MKQGNRKEIVRNLLNLDGIRVSIYLPTHRSFPDNKKDPIVYKNLLQEVEKTLTEQYPRREWEGMMKGLYHLLEDADFWNYTADGLGVLAVGDTVETFSLDDPVEPAFTVGTTFHLLPLFLLSDTADRAFLADIGRDRFRMFAVHNGQLHEVDPPHMKSSFPELYDDHDPNANLRTGGYRGLDGAYHGQGGRPRQAEIDREKYFRYLDSGFQRVHDNSGLPFILAGTEDSVAQFRKLAKGRFYLEEAVLKPIESLDMPELKARLDSITAPYQAGRLEGLNTAISNKRGNNQMAANPRDIAEAAEQGLVETLILPRQLKDNQQALLHKAAEDTIKNGGTVLVTDGDELDVPEKWLALLYTSR